MEGWHVHLAILATLLTSVVLAEDFKTIAGKEYHDVTITRVEGDGIVLKSKTGISKVYFSELSKDVQEKFHYAQSTPIAVQREGDASALGTKKDGAAQSVGGGKVAIAGQGFPHRQAEGSGRVLVLGQSAGTIKFFVAGIVLLAVVVLAIVRSRF